MLSTELGLALTWSALLPGAIASCSIETRSFCSSHSDTTWLLSMLAWKSLLASVAESMFMAVSFHERRTWLVSTGVPS